jgi:hypothetical protein
MKRIHANIRIGLTEVLYIKVNHFADELTMCAYII